MLCIFYYNLKRKRKKKGLCKLGSFSTKKKTPKCTQVLYYSMHFRKPSVRLCPCPLLHDEVHLQFPYFSWRVRKVLCYPSPLWWRLLVLTSKVPSSSWVSHWWHFSILCTRWSSRLVLIRANMPHLGVWHLFPALSLFLCWPNEGVFKDWEEGGTVRRNEPGSPSDCVEQSFTAALHETGTGMRINLYCVKPLEFYSC